MSIILTPFAKLLLLFFHLTGSYGMALIIFCLVIKLILFPISLKGRNGMLAMSNLAEEQKRLQQKYAKDRQKYSEELATLYSREHVKPSSGCVWSMLPLPILMGLYAIVRKPLTYLMGLTSDQVNELSNFLYNQVLTKGSPELTMAQDLYNRFNEVITNLPDLASKVFPMNFTFLGINLSSTPNLMMFTKEGWATWGNIGLFLIPIVSAILGFVSMKVTNWVNEKVTGKVTTQDQTTKTMNLFMPLISLWLCFTLPAGLGIYWIANSVFGILQEFASIGLLKKYLKQLKEKKKKTEEEEKEKSRQQKKIAAQQRQQAQAESRRIHMERKVGSGDIVTESRVGIRAYARGRTYDQDRHPVTPYHDPDDIAREQREQREKEAAEGKKNKRKGSQQEAPVVESALETAAETPAETERNLEDSNVQEIVNPSAETENGSEEVDFETQDPAEDPETKE